MQVVDAVPVVSPQGGELGDQGVDGASDVQVGGEAGHSHHDHRSLGGGKGLGEGVLALDDTVEDRQIGA